jgi:hypothetical protein
VAGVALQRQHGVGAAADAFGQLGQRQRQRFAVVDYLAPSLGEFVFTTNGRTAISGWSYAKRKIDALMGEEMGSPVSDWRLHDLRRTMASGLAMLGFRAEVIKRVLGHAANANDVTAVHYNWHNYDAEALEAVAVWATHVATLTKGEVTESISSSVLAGELSSEEAFNGQSDVNFEFQIRAKA